MPARTAAGLLPVLALACAWFAAPAAAAPSAEDIGVERAGGRVTITASGVERAARAGTILPLPSALQTGRDGSADLRQGPTTIGVGPDTRLDFPAPTARDAFDRVVQAGGQAFYDVGPRGSRKLRVETPYLVAVIKGTQFNVVVTDDSTTISLFEGSLELLATDGEASVRLNAGEIAIRRKGEDAIRVLPMKDDAVTAGAGKRAGGGTGDTKDPAVAGKVDVTGALPLDPLPADGDVKGEVKGDVTVATPALPVDPVDGKVAVGVDADIGTTQVEPGADADLGLATGGATLDATAEADVGIATDAGGVTLDAGVDAAADLGTGAIDAAIDTGAGVAVDAGTGTIDAGLDATADLGGGTLDAGLDAGVDLATDAGAGTVDASLDVGADLGGVDAGIGVDAGVDLTGSDAGVELGVDLLATEVDLGLDPGGSPADSGTTTTTEQSGGLLGGILGRTGP